MLLQEVGVNTNQLKLKHYFAWPCILPTKRPADHWSTPFLCHCVGAGIERVGSSTARAVELSEQKKK